MGVIWISDLFGGYNVLVPCYVYTAFWNFCLTACVSVSEDSARGYLTCCGSSPLYGCYQFLFVLFFLFQLKAPELI